ncbi:MAG: DUF4845 domain-containing protein [Burkholderiales bacterium]|nr:DUF4845 domain-containing protein [Burkholderiales bacterium]OJX08133.1 MAG: hypothetical protein BGO72_01145 [Burkholderiales bacterium 70-64]
MNAIPLVPRRRSPQRPARRAQRGLSLIGLLVVAAVLVFAALLVMKVAPSAIEYRAIRSAISKIETSGTSGVREVQTAFDRYAAIDDITSISGKDLLVEKRPDGATMISFRYEKRIPLFGPASLVIDYQGAN